MKKIATVVLSALSLGMFFASCTNDESGNVTSADPAKVSFVVTSGDPVSDLTGGVYMKVFTGLSNVKTNQKVYGDDENGVKSYDSFTQVSYNKQSGVFVGYIYARGASAKGIGSLKAGLRSYKIVSGKLSEIADPVYVSAFGNTGTFGTYSYAAQISQPQNMVVDANGKGNNIQLTLPQYAIDEVNPNISNIVDMGNNKVSLVMNYSNRDSAAVAICDYNLNISKVIYDGRIGSSVGAQRSVRYTQSGADDDGNIYVFCGSSAADSKVGALRINKDETEFDANYKFDILTVSGGYRFRKAFHIGGDKFLLEFYNSKTSYGNMDASGKMAVIDMGDKSLVWVTGLPDPTTVSIGWGDGYDGNYYLPIAAATSFNTSTSTTDVAPTIYKINGETGAASVFMTFEKGDLLKAINIIK